MAFHFDRDLGAPELVFLVWEKNGALRQVELPAIGEAQPVKWFPIPWELLFSEPDEESNQPGSTTPPRKTRPHTDWKLIMPARDLTLTLPPDLGRALAEQAKRLGTTPELLALDSLRKHFVAAVSEKASTAGMETMADFLDGYIGVLDSREHTPGGRPRTDKREKWR